MENQLFAHKPHPHKPTNANVLHKTEQEIAGFNQRLAVNLTRIVGTVWTAYAFAGLACIGLLAILGVLGPLVALLVAWVSQTFLQLVFLPILSVGQGVLARKQELQADAQFADVEKIYHDIEQIMHHLDAQDTELVHLESSLSALNRSVAQLIQRVDRATGRGAA